MEKHLRFNEGEGELTLSQDTKTDLEKLQKIAPEFSIDMNDIISKAIEQAKTKPELVEKARNLFFNVLKNKNPGLAKKILVRVCERYSGGNKLSKDKIYSLVNSAFKLEFSKALSFIKNALARIAG